MPVRDITAKLQVHKLSFYAKLYKNLNILIHTKILLLGIWKI